MPSPRFRILVLLALLGALWVVSGQAGHARTDASKPSVLRPSASNVSLPQHPPDVPATTTTTPIPSTAPTTSTTVAPPAPVPASTPAPDQPKTPDGTYTVQSGDTLALIAAAHGLDWPGLCQANRLADCSRIYPGQVLELKSVPVPVAPPAVAPTITPTTSPDGCAEGAAYVAANAAPGFTYQCYPGASERQSGVANDVGFTRWQRVTNPDGSTVTTGTIYIDSNCALPIVWETESSNSRVVAGLSNDPIDKFGPAPIGPGCHPSGL